MSDSDSCATLNQISSPKISQNPESLLWPIALSSSVSMLMSPITTIFSYVVVAMSTHLLNSEKKSAKFSDPGGR